MGQELIPVMRGPELTFVVVGRLEPGKGVLRLIECCGRLKQEGEQFALWVIGDGEEREKLKKRADELGLGANVRFLGAQSNPYAHIWLKRICWCVLHLKKDTVQCALKLIC